MGRRPVVGWFSRLTGAGRDADAAPAALDRVLAIAYEATGPSPATGGQITALACTRPDEPTRCWVVTEMGQPDGRSGESVDEVGLARQLAEQLAEADLVVAHGAPAAQRFASALLADHDLAMPHTQWMCTMRLAKALEPAWPSYRLDACAAEIGVGQPLTGAASKAEATAALFTVLRSRAGDPSLPELIDRAGLRLDSGSDEPVLAAGARPSAAGETADGVTVRYGRGGDIVIELELSIDERLLDPDVPREVKRAILAQMRADRQVCGTDRLADLTDPAHRVAHEHLYDLDFSAPLDSRVAVLEELLAAGCPHAADEWLNLPYRCGSGTKGTFEVRMLVLRAFRDRCFASPDQVRQVAQYLYQVNDIKAGSKLLLGAWRELGPWLQAYAPCSTCRELGRQCTHFDLAYQAASAMEWDSGEGELLRVAQYLAAPDGSKPALAGRAKEYVALMTELSQSSPSGYARLACSVAQAAEKEYPDLAVELYYPNVRSGLAERYEYDRLSLLLERAKRYAEAADVAELGLAHPDCGNTRGETLRKRVARCRAKAVVPVKPARLDGEAGEIETLTCVTCGREFNRVRTRGRKPHQCPDCRA